MIRKEIILLILIIWVKSTAQELPDISPKSPEATEFVKYGNTSVSMYTGKPDINIPVYTIQGREFNLPISLNYDAGGIKVNQIATQVGLAWSLQAGGFITRITNGKPDHVIGTASSYNSSYYTEYDKLKAFYQTFPTLTPYSLPVESASAYVYTPVSPPYLSTLTEYFLLEEEIFKGLIDTQPDYFSFSVGNISGDIYIDPISGEARCSNGKNYKISYTGSLTDFNGGGITNWHITDEQGNQYFFDIYDLTETFSDSSGENDIKKYISSWQLTQIISANGKDVYGFDYTYSNFWVNEKFVPRALSSISTLVSDTPGVNICEEEVPHYNSNLTSYKIAQNYLSSIKLNNKEIINFQQSVEERKDLSSRYALEKITIANNIDWSFHQSYFKSDPNIDLNNITSITEDDIRLKLDSITITSSISNTVQNTYNFDYFNPNNVPNLQSFSQDYWGFYNGKTNNTIYGLIPKETVLINNTVQSLPGADRAPDFDNGKNGTLYRITYPTGGHTEFEYESHSVYKSTEEVVFNDTEIGRLIGGDDLTNPYNYYDDEFFFDTPKGIENFVPVYESGPKDIKIRYAAPNPPVGGKNEGILFVAILKCDETTVPISPDSCDGAPIPFLPNCPTGLQWEDIINYPASKRMLVKSYKGGTGTGALPDGYIETIPLDLDAGYYKVYILNGVTNSGLTVNLRYPETKNSISEKPIGGLRVKNTKDYINDSGIPILTKYYSYTKAILNACDNLVSVSSGKLHFNPIYSQYSYYDRYKPEGLDGCQYIDRFSYPLNAIQSPHIAYSSVKESYESESVSGNGYNEYHFYNTVSENGAVEPYIPILKSDFKNGNISKILSYDTANNLKRKIINNYSQTQVENSIHGYKSTQGRFKIDFQLAVIQRNDGKQVYKLLAPFFISGAPAFPHFPNPIKTFSLPSYTNELGNPSFSSGKSNTTYLISNNYLHLDETVTIDYFESDSIITKTNYFYDGLAQFPKIQRQVSRTLSTNSNGNTVETHTFYPEDVKNISSLGNDPLTTQEFNAIDLLKETKSNGSPGQHRMTTPVQVKTTIKNFGGTVLSKSTQRTNFKTFNGQITLPEFIQAAKNNEPLEDRIVYHNYDNYGNPLEVSKADGSHISYIWGYDKQYPVAKLENATRSQIEALTGFGSNFHAGATGLTSTQENTLRTNLPNAMVSTYTYDPLIGVTSMTDPRGYTMYYHYDDFNRLKFVKDADGNLVSENKYNYKN